MSILSNVHRGWLAMPLVASLLGAGVLYNRETNKSLVFIYIFGIEIMVCVQKLNYSMSDYNCIKTNYINKPNLQYLEIVKSCLMYTFILWHGISLYDFYLVLFVVPYKEKYV